MKQQETIKYCPTTVVNTGQFGDQLILYHAMSKQYYVLTAVGAQAWQLLDGKRSIADIGKILVKHYTVEIDKVQSDLSELFQGLSDFGLVQVVD
ncbi:MAG: PqqD family protein [Bacteroidota bacterium]